MRPIDPRRNPHLGALRTASAALLLASATIVAVPIASANHPVLVEGNCQMHGPMTTNVPPGTCGDYDGDGLVGTAEDTDNNTDRVFGTINAALGMANNGANQNGRVTIVTSGRFAEVVHITPTAGNVTLEAAPGVEANIDAVLQGDPGSAMRQMQPGIIITANNDRRVTVRNVVSRNWTDGILVQGDSHVTLDNVRVENNTDYGIHVVGNARVAIINSQVNANGFRTTAAGVSTPNPGGGISFEESASGVVAFTTVTGNFAAGIENETDSWDAVALDHVVVFDNNPDFEGVH